jgi:lipoate-protein ligase A
MKVFRVIDTGLREGRRQIAFDQALIEARKAGRIPDTIRFLRFPPTALVGRHQALAREIRLDYCRERGIGVARRVTGGGAIYFDEGMLGWELVFERASLGIATLAELAREICEAAAAGLSRLGIEARYRPRNDIEVGGRKLSGTGGFFDEDTLFYQGTVLVDTDPADMVAALNVAQAKLARRALESAAQRVVTLKALLGTAPPPGELEEALLAGFRERLGIEPVRGAITAGEEDLARALYEQEIGTDAFVAEIDDPERRDGVRCGTQGGAGGTVDAFVRLDGPGDERIGHVLFTGDFLVAPPRIVYDLEAVLRNTPVDEAGAVVERFFADARVGLLSVAPRDFAAALEAACAAAPPCPPR